MSQARQGKWLPPADLDIGVCLRTNEMRAFATPWLSFILSIHTFHPCSEMAGGPGCSSRKLGLSLLRGCSLLPVSDITSQYPWHTPWLPSPHSSLISRISPTFRTFPPARSFTFFFSRPPSFFQNHFLLALCIFWHIKTHFPPNLNSFHA